MAYQDMSSNWFYKKPVLAADLNQLGENDNWLKNNNLNYLRLAANNTGSLIGSDLNSYMVDSGGDQTLATTITCSSNLIRGQSILRIYFEIFAPSYVTVTITIIFKNMSDTNYPSVYLLNDTTLLQIDNNLSIAHTFTSHDWKPLNLTTNKGFLIGNDKKFKIDVFLRAGGSPSIRNIYIYEFPEIIV